MTHRGGGVKTGIIWFTVTNNRPKVSIDLNSNEIDTGQQEKALSRGGNPGQKWEKEGWANSNGIVSEAHVELILPLVS